MTDPVRSLRELKKLARDAFAQSREVMHQSMILKARAQMIGQTPADSLDRREYPHTAPARGMPSGGNGDSGTRAPGRVFSCPLSKRELEVLRHLADGRSSREVAALLGICFKTATCHRANIMAKLDVHDAASLVRRAIRWGLVEP